MLMNEVFNPVSENVESSVKEKVDLIEMAAKVYEGLTDDQIDEIERIALDRDNWKR